MKKARRGVYEGVAKDRSDASTGSGMQILISYVIHLFHQAIAIIIITSTVAQ